MKVYASGYDLHEVTVGKLRGHDLYSFRSPIPVIGTNVFWAEVLDAAWFQDHLANEEARAVSWHQVPLNELLILRVEHLLRQGGS